MHLSNKQFDQLICNQTQYLIKYHNDIYDISEWIPNERLDLHIYPGSFNPLHDAHKSIYQYMFEQNHYHSNRCLYEISINRHDKPIYSLNDINNILDQFSNHPVLITNQSRFLNKVGTIFDINEQWYPIYYIGIDTFNRLVSDLGIAGISALRCRFNVFDRIIENTRYSLNNYSKIPKNCECIKNALSNDIMRLSSTAIRKGK